jgi:hypothetical protein
LENLLMSNLTQLTATTGPVVAPGTTTSSQYYTSVGWSAGEYIYQTSAGLVTPRTTSGIGYNATYNGGNTLLTGSSYTPGTVQSVQYSPLFDYGTFAGTSQTAGTQVGSSTTVTASNVDNLYAFNLINGNVGVVYSIGGTGYLFICTPTGSTVYGPTAVASSSGISSAVVRGGISGCCTTGGTIYVTWGDGTNQYYASYTQTGTVVAAKTTYRAGNQIRFHQTIALSNGGFASCGSGSQPGQLYLVVSDSTVSTFTLSTVTSVSVDYGVCCQLTNGNIACGGYDSTNSRIGLAVQLSTASSQVWNGYPDSSVGSYISLVAVPDAKFAVTYPNGSSQLYCSIYNGATGSTSSPVINTAVNTGTTSGNGGASAVQISQAGIATVYVLGYAAGSFANLYSVAFNSGTSASGTVTALFTSSSTIPYIGAITNTLNGKVLISYRAATTNYVTVGSWATQTLTNGSTTLYGNNYTLKEGYTLLGVAATTVAAGATGPVITNGGSVTLNTNYPTVTSPVSFNYQGPYNGFAQRGTVVNKVATLKGLES